MAAPDSYRILVVDDDALDRMAVRRALRAAGVDAHVDEARDAPAGLRALREGRYDCVLLDYQLPGGDGLSVLRSAREAGIDTPVVMLTGHGDQETAVELMKSGAADFVSKAAITPERLAQGIRHAVRVHRAEEQARRAESALRESEERFRSAFEDGAVGTALVAVDGRFLRVNTALARMLGWSVDELLQRRFADVSHPDGLAEDEARMARALGGEVRSYQSEKRYVARDGRAVPTLESVSLVRGGDGEPLYFVTQVQDLTDQEEARAALQESEARLRRISESGMVGMLFWQVDGGITSANETFLRMAGYSAEDLAAGRVNWVTMTPPEWLEADRAALAQLAGHGVAEAYEKEFVRPDGSRIPVLVSAATFEQTAEQGVTLVLDMTQRKRMEQEREAALASRSRFYAAMSHELRTPINAILGYNDLLLSGVYGDMSEVQSSGVERSQRAARHLLDLVNDVLDISKLEAGKMEITPEPASIPELVRDLFATVRPLAADSGSALHLQTEDADPPILTDPRRVRQILLNLLSNAIKFGRARPVSVCVRGAADGGITVEVADQGEGIPADHLERVFEEFVQLPDANLGGTGLGLPISRRLAAMLGGRLEAESVVGTGSVFRLVLPPTIPAATLDVVTLV
ncbi:PAS domain S-box protein [Longimicrobium terrae]|uniref:histidine kinase n=1 Tax=Longimicrobium terrae TaxID=1639882 RepID=A0A841GZX0_9BACT|nr:PAS domain S-box-containing protein [Longimicrobium terrae]MBB6071297.1 PAS domain S-box-containing protein [Longimicrobium terrae]NNC29341.1 PAS domain S-box protein [Longimicrobium terrae]